MVPSRYEQLTAPFRAETEDAFQIWPWVSGGLLAVVLVWMTLGTAPVERRKVKEPVAATTSSAPVPAPQLPDHLEAALLQMGTMAGLTPSAFQIQKNDQILSLSLPLKDVLSADYRNLSPPSERFLKNLAVRLLIWPVQVEIEAQLPAATGQRTERWEQAMLSAGRLANFLVHEKVAPERLMLRTAMFTALSPAAVPRILIYFRARSQTLSSSSNPVLVSPTSSVVPVASPASPAAFLAPTAQPKTRPVPAAVVPVPARTIRRPVKKLVPIRSRVYPRRKPVYYSRYRRSRSQ